LNLGIGLDTNTPTDATPGSFDFQYGYYAANAVAFDPPLQSSAPGTWNYEYLLTAGNGNDKPSPANTNVASAGQQIHVAAWSLEVLETGAVLPTSAASVAFFNSTNGTSTAFAALTAERTSPAASAGGATLGASFAVSASAASVPQGTQVKLRVRVWLV
jgi:hypothetical protein